MNMSVCSGRGLPDAMAPKSRFVRFSGYLRIVVSMLLLLGMASVQAANQKPVAIAGEDQSVGLGDRVQLNGGRSYDNDGRVSRFRWKQVKGKKVTLKNAKSAAPSFVAPLTLPAKQNQKTLVFKLTVTDDKKKQTTDQVAVNLVVCQPPQFLLNGICQAPLPVCYAPKKWINGICAEPEELVCTEPLVKVDGVCLMPDPVCILPEVLQNGVCAAASAASGINDTGITQCSDTTINSDACPVAVYPGQDAEFGRDKLIPDDSDGHAGFSFSKIDAAGLPLATDAREWSCVKDNVTGLVWELKTDDGGLRDKDNVFTDYSVDFNPANTYQTAGDASSYAPSVNAQGLCGANDWRLPTADELQSIVHYGLLYPGPAIDSAFFPNSANGVYWTSTAHAGDPQKAWVVFFDDGRLFADARTEENHIRLVRTATDSAEK